MNIIWQYIWVWHASKDSLNIDEQFDFSFQKTYETLKDNEKEVCLPFQCPHQTVFPMNHFMEVVSHYSIALSSSVHT